MSKNWFYPMAKVLCIAIALFVINAFSLETQISAFAIPPTPDVVANELDKTKDPTVALQNIKELSQDHKQELKEGPKPIQNNAKEITKNIQTPVKLAVDKLDKALKSN
jgi:hypothetical protein